MRKDQFWLRNVILGQQKPIMSIFPILDTNLWSKAFSIVKCGKYQAILSWSEGFLQEWHVRSWANSYPFCCNDWSKSFCAKYHRTYWSQSPTFQRYVMYLLNFQGSRNLGTTHAVHWWAPQPTFIWAKNYWKYFFSLPQKKTRHQSYY